MKWVSFIHILQQSKEVSKDLNALEQGIFYLSYINFRFLYDISINLMDENFLQTTISPASGNFNFFQTFYFLTKRFLFIKVPWKTVVIFILSRICRYFHHWQWPKHMMFPMHLNIKVFLVIMISLFHNFQQWLDGKLGYKTIVQHIYLYTF